MVKPIDVIRRWVQLVNTGNSEELAELYHDDATIHRVPGSSVEGKTAIQVKFLDEFKLADVVFIVEHIFEDGDWAILEWKNSLSLQGCEFFKISKGKIISQRSYTDRLSYAKAYKLPMPE